MNVHELLAPRPGPVPPLWRSVTQVAAGVVFLLVATSRWFPVWRLLDVTGLGPLAFLSPLLTLALWVAAGLAAAAVVLLGQRRPGAATVLALLPLLPAVVLGTSVPFAVVAVLVGITVATAWRSPTGAVLTTAVAVAVVGAWLVVAVPMSAPFDSYVELQYTNRAATGVLYALALAVVLAGTLVGRVAVGRTLDQQQRLVVRSAEVEEQSAVTAERARLARDLHDVVAHHVSLIAVRAETAPYTHPTLGAEARSVLAEIAGDARRALDELRSVLGILGRATAEDRLPQPTWHDVGGLVARATASGELVELVGDAGADVDPTTGYVAYRVVQEGLTNARKHAPGAPVTVRLERTSHLAVVSVVSGLPGGGPVPSAGPADPAVTAPISGLPWRDAGPDADERAVPDTAVLGADGPTRPHARRATGWPGCGSGSRPSGDAWWRAPRATASSSRPPCRSGRGRER